MVMVAISAFTTVSTSALARDEKPAELAPKDLALEGLAKIISALELFGQSIPQYDAPEVLPNGDIIIRRKNSENPPFDDRPDDETGNSAERPKGSI